MRSLLQGDKIIPTTCGSSPGLVNIPDKFNQLKVLILLPFFTAALSFLCIFIIFPFYIYRSLVSILAKWVDPKICRVLIGLSASLLRDHDSHSTKPLSTIVICVKGQGSLTIGQFRHLFQTRIIEKRKGEKCGDNGTDGNKELQFPELQQYYKQFMGYIFLRWDTHFQVENHVKSYHDDDDICDKGKGKRRKRKDLLEIWEDLMVKPFKKRMSPWEAIFVENYEEDGVKRIVIFLRIHHGIADGFSVQQMLCNADHTYYSTEPTTTTSGSPSTDRITKIRNTFQKIFNHKAAIFYGPYDLLRRMLLFKEPYHTFHLPAAHQRKEYFVVQSPVMLVGNVKLIKTRFGVSFTSVLIATVCGGIRKFLEKNSQRPFPDLQCLGIPLSTGKERSNKLENEFLIAPLNLPIGVNHPVQRLHCIERQLVQLGHSSITKILGLSIDALSCLPVNMMKRVTTRSVFSTAYSTLPGPSKTITLPSGAKLDQISFTYGTGAASLGLCFSSITYHDQFKITIFVDKALMDGKRDKAEEMMAALTQEYHNLYHLSQQKQ